MNAEEAWQCVLLHLAVYQFLVACIPQVDYGRWNRVTAVHLLKRAILSVPDRNNDLEVRAGLERPTIAGNVGVSIGAS